MKKISRDQLKSYIFDNGREYLLKILAADPRSNRWYGEEVLVRTGREVLLTISTDNIESFYAYINTKGYKTNITVLNLFNPLEHYIRYECHIEHGILEKILSQIKNMNKRRYKKINKESIKKIKSRSEILEIE